MEAISYRIVECGEPKGPSSEFKTIFRFSDLFDDVFVEEAGVPGGN
jgi:hypothetical protein